MAALAESPELTVRVLDALVDDDFRSAAEIGAAAGVMPSEALLCLGRLRVAGAAENVHRDGRSVWRRVRVADPVNG